jgi:glycosyltransferase involved in cell wall biosynthesis
LRQTPSLRILHVMNPAGVPMTIAKYQALIGFHTMVLARKSLDPFSFAEAYRNVRYVFPDRASTIYALSILLSPFYDILHVHAADKVAYMVKLVNRKSRVVLHYHGSDIRGRWRERRVYWSKVDKVIVSTPDLLDGAPEGVTYVPNPVDTELFKPYGGERRPKGLLIVKWRRFHQYKHIKHLADELARQYGIEYDVRFSDLEPVKYIDMPKLLNQYEWFLDIHHGFGEEDRVLKALSLTGLQALACGCKVITPWSNKYLIGLPEEHKPLNVVNRLLKIYRELLE